MNVDPNIHPDFLPTWAMLCHLTSSFAPAITTKATRGLLSVNAVLGLKRLMLLFTWKQSQNPTYISLELRWRLWKSMPVYVGKNLTFPSAVWSSRTVGVAFYSNPIAGLLQKRGYRNIKCSINLWHYEHFYLFQAPIAIIAIVSGADCNYGACFRWITPQMIQARATHMAS